MNRLTVVHLQSLPFITLYGKVGKCYSGNTTRGSSMTYPFQSLKTANLPPRRQKNVDRRVREYLSHREVEELRKAARKETRHGLRVSEIASLKWQQVDLKIGLLHVKRLKKGIPSTHPLRGLELRALRQLARDYPDSPYIFVSERRSPLSPRTIRHIVCEAGEKTGFSFPLHPHMLRHSTGFYLANKGVDTRSIQSYMGHARIDNTVIYTALNVNRFNDFFSD